MRLLSGRMVLVVIAASLFCVAVSSPAESSFHGRVLDRSGQPLSGAVVSARSRSLARVTTVYADAEGRYALPEVEEGIYDLRARAFGYRDGAAMEVTPSGGEIDFSLEPETDEYDRFSQLPSNRWLALVLAQIPNERMREEFVRQCNYCHQQGSWATRVERSPQQWEKIFSLMARMGGVLSAETRAALPGVLNAAYNPANALPALKAQIEQYPLPNPAGQRVVIDEWEAGDRASMLHDIMVHPSGLIYAVDTTRDFLYRLDPKTSKREAFPIPDGGLPIGGIFRGAGTLLPPDADAHVAPHSLQVAPDGKIWVTLCLGNKVGVFDPETESWKLIDQAEGIYPHTLRFDAKGRAWYTLAASNHVSVIDPRTGEQRTVRLPTRTWTQAVAVRALPLMMRLAEWLPMPETASAGTLPPVAYGIDIAPDGGVWISQLNASRIGRIDPDTLSVEMIDTPFTGPRRLRFDSQGNLWIPGFSSSLIARFNPKTREFKTWDLPTQPKGTETPYALNVDRKTDTVWVCAANSDSLLRFDPRTETFTVFPLPTRVTFTREIDFDTEGAIWTSNSNTPAWQIETAKPQIIRLRLYTRRSLPAQ